MKLPDHLVFPLAQFAESCAEKKHAGLLNLAQSCVAFVGLARNCGRVIRHNLERIASFGVDNCGEWLCHVQTNDNTDDTANILESFCRSHERIASYENRILNRQQYSVEFAGPRTEALAEYRTACQAWVKAKASHADYVVVVDLDQWGGWSDFGLANGVGWLLLTPDAYGMASVSLFQMPATSVTGDDVQKFKAWLHYDAWALRLNSYVDDYTIGLGGWKHQWIPFVGSDPVPVRSAFGGLCVYRAADFMRGRYSGEDCEHVPFHRSIAEASGRRLYLNPTQRCVMQWLE